jgi:hypothetical protein
MSSKTAKKQNVKPQSPRYKGYKEQESADETVTVKSMKECTDHVFRIPMGDPDALMIRDIKQMVTAGTTYSFSWLEPTHWDKLGLTINPNDGLKKIERVIKSRGGIEGGKDDEENDTVEERTQGES